MIAWYLYICITMATFKTYDIGDSYSVVMDLGSLLPSDHLCKKIEKIVSELDTGSIEKEYSSIGQNALHPKLMLSVIFYGYAIGIRSGRKLATACQENIPFIYLSKGHFPKKSTINDFRKDNYLFFSDLFLQVLKKCMEASLADPELSIADGSKLESNSSKGRTKTKEQYEKWKVHLLEDIAVLEKSLEMRESSDTDKSVQTKKNSNRKNG